MKTALLHTLCCPACHGDLSCDVQHAKGGIMLEGRLTCGACGRRYSVREGIAYLVTEADFAPQNLLRVWEYGYA